MASWRTTGRTELRTGLPALLAILLVASAACSSDGGSDRSATLVVRSRGGAVSVKQGQRVVIALESNPSTGFTWTQIGDPTSAGVVLSVRESSTKSNTSLVGAPGTQRFEYRAAKSGTATITLRYARPSAPDAPGSTTLTYDVTVE